MSRHQRSNSGDGAVATQHLLAVDVRVRGPANLLNDMRAAEATSDELKHKSRHRRVLSWDIRLPKLRQSEQFERSVRYAGASASLSSNKDLAQKSSVDTFDWLQDSSGSEASGSTPISNGDAAHLQVRRQRRTRCLCISPRCRCFMAFLAWLAISIVPGTLYYVLPNAHSWTMADITLFDWSLLACTVLLGYHTLRVVTWMVLQFVKRNATPGELKVVFQIEHLSWWINLVYFMFSIMIAELSILHLRMCSDIFHPERCKWQLSWLPNASGAAFVSSVVFLVQKVTVQHIAIKFHAQQCTDRIQTAKLMEKMLETINQARKNKKLLLPRAKERRCSSPSSPIDGWRDYRKTTSVPVSQISTTAAGLPSCSLPGAAPSAISTSTLVQADERNTTSSVSDSASIHTLTDGCNEQLPTFQFPGYNLLRPKMIKLGIHSKYDAKKMSKRLFLFLSPVNETLCIDDFTPYISVQKTREEYFALIQKADSNHITKKEFRDAIVKAFKDRKNLSNSLNHLEQVLGKLDSICFGFACFLNLFLWLLFFNVNVLNVFVSFTSVVFAMTFVFGNSAKNAFESLILLFVMHPFDIGDKILVENEVYIVEQLNITFSIFRRGDGTQVYFPNHLLVQKIILNTRRSGDTSDTIQIDVGYEITHTQFMELRTAIGEYLKTEPQDWTGRFEVMPQEYIQDGHKLRLSISAQGKGNFVDGTRRYHIV